MGTKVKRVLTCDRCRRTKTFEYREECNEEDKNNSEERIKEEWEWQHLCLDDKVYLICPECNAKLNSLTKKFIWDCKDGRGDKADVLRYYFSNQNAELNDGAILVWFKSNLCDKYQLGAIVNKYFPDARESRKVICPYKKSGVKDVENCGFELTFSIDESVYYEIGSVYFVTVTTTNRDFLMREEGTIWESM